MIDINNPGSNLIPLSNAFSTIIGSRLKDINDATYTITDDDHGYMLNVTVGCTITVPAGLRAGFSCGWLQRSVDQITFDSSGTTIVEPDNNTMSEKQWATGGLTSLGSETYILYGRTA